MTPLLFAIAIAHARSLPTDAGNPGVTGIASGATDHALAAVDWTATGEETLVLLQELVRAPSINEPGNETLAVEVLERWLGKEGIATERVELSDTRSSLIARLPGTGKEKPICLLSHVDVVPAEPARWSVAPFDGIVKDGFLYGRGVLDMKGMTALETMTMIQLKRLGVPLRREVILLAVADEEVASLGMESVVAMWDKIGCSHSVNEGGFGLRGLFFDDQTFHAISVAEKGAVWLKMIATGEPGHGSTPVVGRAPERLTAALEKLAARKDPPHWNAALMESFRRSGEHAGGVSGAVLQSPFLVKLLVKPRLYALPPTRAALTNTVNVTGFFGGSQPNVVPSEVGAILDCRILPGETREALLAELTALVDDPAIRFELISETNANGSPWDDPFFAALAARAVEGQSDAVAGPVVSVGYTDSQALRPLGVHAYGYVPFIIDGELLKGNHGDDERVPVSEIGPGVRRLLSAVMDVSLDTEGAPRPGIPPRTAPR